MATCACTPPTTPSPSQASRAAPATASSTGTSPPTKKPSGTAGPASPAGNGPPPKTATSAPSALPPSSRTWSTTAAGSSLAVSMGPLSIPSHGPPGPLHQAHLSLLARVALTDAHAERSSGYNTASRCTLLFAIRLSINILRLLSCVQPTILVFLCVCRQWQWSQSPNFVGICVHLVLYNLDLPVGISRCASPV